MTKRILSIILVIVLFSTMFSSVVLAEEHLFKVLLFSENFEGYEIGEKPDMNIYDSSGSVFVDTIGASKVLNIRNVNAISNTTVEKEINRVEGKKVIFSVNFMQTQTGSSKNTVLAIHDGDINFSIIADKGAFYIGDTQLSQYVANKWYTITSIIDLANSTTEIYINGEKKSDNLTIPLKGFDKFSFIASQSPGFYLDNIKIETEQSATEFYIEGVDLVAIPKNGKSTHLFSAVLKDDSGYKIPLSDVDWTYPQYTNVNVIVDENALTLEVSPDAAAGDFEISASVHGNFNATKTVKIEQVRAEELKIVGDRRIAGSSGETRIFSYDIAMKDQTGEDISDYGKFTWTMSGVDGYEIPEYISLDANTGEITVTSDTPYREFIKLKATSVDNPAVWQEKKILVTDEHSYILDNYRYDAVKTHIDNALVFAKDPYDDSPLLSDLINVNAKQPGAYIASTGEPVVTHNLYALSPLMRSMINLSNFEEDDSYRQEVLNIYKYNMDIAPNPTYLYEGGHMAVDLKVKGLGQAQQLYVPNTNETKGGYTYRAPMFELDYDRATLWSKATFIGHAGFNHEENWKNMQISRHWNVVAHALNETTVAQYWNDTESYDRERKGTAYVADEVQFVVAYGEALTLLAEYYKNAKTDEEKEMILKWGDIVYSSLDQTGYDPLTGEYNGLFNQVNGSLYNEDWSKIHDIWETHGKEWYKKQRSGLKVGDRLFANTILSDRDLRPISEGGEGFGPSSNGESWVDMYYNEDPYKGVNEQNWKYFLEPYMMARENWLITSFMGLYNFIDVLEDGDELRTKLIEKYTNTIYNYLNLRYDPVNSNFRSCMSWGLDITNWRAPHDGYYYLKGAYINTKMPEPAIVTSLAQLIKFANIELENTGADEFATYTYPENKRKEQLEKQTEYIWSVLRDLCKKNFELGDIGDPLNGEKPNLNFATTSTSTEFLSGFIGLYQFYPEEDYLKMAQILANNIVASYYNEGAGLFTNQGTLLASTANKYIYPFLALEAVLIDDFDNLIEAKTYTLPGSTCDFNYLKENGVSTNGDIFDVFTGIKEPSVKQSALIIEDDFSMQIGESRKIEYKVLPYDATTEVLWDVSDPEIADISSSGIIKAKRSGTVKVRCVSSSVKGLSSETITVTIE